MFSVILQILQEEGIPGLYKGFGATMLNTFSMRTFVLMIFHPLIKIDFFGRVRLFLLLFVCPYVLHQTDNIETSQGLQSPNTVDCSGASIGSCCRSASTNIHDTSIRNRYSAANWPLQSLTESDSAKRPREGRECR